MNAKSVSRYLFVIYSALIFVSQVFSFKTASANLSDIFASHPKSLKYNFYLNRFMKIEDQSLIDSKIKSAKKVQLLLVMDIKNHYEKFQLIQKDLDQKVANLKLQYKSQLPLKIVELGKQIKEASANYLDNLLELKHRYQEQLDKSLGSTFYSYSESQKIWKNILDEITTAIEKVRIDEGIDVVIQTNSKRDTYEQFFSELDHQINDYVSQQFWNISEDPRMTESFLEYIAPKVATNQFLRILPNPLDITALVRDRIINTK